METMEKTIPKEIKNPFVPITMEKVYADLAKARQQIAEGKCQPMDEALDELGRRYGFI